MFVFLHVVVLIVHFSRNQLFKNSNKYPHVGLDLTGQSELRSFKQSEPICKVIIEFPPDTENQNDYPKKHNPKPHLLHVHPLSVMQTSPLGKTCKGTRGPGESKTGVHLVLFNDFN